MQVGGIGPKAAGRLPDGDGLGARQQAAGLALAAIAATPAGAAPVTLPQAATLDRLPVEYARALAELVKAQETSDGLTVGVKRSA